MHLFYKPFISRIKFMWTKPFGDFVCLVRCLFGMITYFVGGVGVPDDEFSVLRGGHEVARVCAPVHRIHLQPEVCHQVVGSFYLRPCINVVTIIIIVIITTGIMMKMRPWTNVLGGFFASSSVFSRLAPCSPLP